MINKRWIYLSVLFISAGMATFAIYMLRFFSLAHFGSYLYIVMSVMVLGAGLAALMISFFKQKIMQKTDFYLSLSVTLSILFVSIGFFILKQLNFYPTQGIYFSFLLKNFFQTLMFFFFLSLPFFFGAFFIILSFTLEKQHLGVISLFERFGGGLGVLFFLILSFFIPHTYLILIPVVLFSLSAFFIIAHEKQASRFILMGVVLIALALPFLFKEITFNSLKDFEKAKQKNAQIVLTQDSYFGKIHVTNNHQEKLWAGISSTYTGKNPEYYGLFVDGNRVSEFVKGGYPDFLDYTPYKIAYNIKKNPRVLALKTGGGLEVLAATYFDAQHISAVEKNEQMIALLKERLSNYTAGIFHKRNVLFYRTGVRPFTASVNKKYDLITTRLYPLQEKSFKDETDYNFSLEAFKSYWKLLEKNGLLMVQTPLQNPPRIELRILSTFKALLDNYKIPHQNLKVFKTPDSFVFLLKQTPFTPQENLTLQNLTLNLKYDEIFPLSQNQKNPYFQLSQAIFNNNWLALQPYDFSLTKITDNSPFLYSSFKIHRLAWVKEVPCEEAGYVLLWITFLVVLLMGGLILYLPIIHKKEFHKKFYLSKLVFFFGGVGAGVIMIQIALIYKINVLFSNMLISTSLVFSSFFIFSGLGSYYAQKFTKKTNGIFIALSSLVSILFIYLFFLDSLISTIIDFKISMRLILACLVPAPIAFLAGGPFPLGLEWVKHFDEKIVPWSFGIHTALGIISAVLSVILGIKIGLSWLFFIAFFCYAVALGSFAWMDYQYQKTNYLYRRYKV